jgi:hypothetical protein
MSQIKKTSLENSADVIDTLKWKMQTIEEKRLPVEMGLADYIELAVSNLTNEQNYLADVKKQVADRDNEVKEQLEAIKVDGAVFLQSMGIEKLKGAICSSVSITKARPESEETTTSQVFTPLISEEEIQELLLALGKAEMRTVTETKTTKALPAKLKVNKRKIALAEVVDEDSNNATATS